MMFLVAKTRRPLALAYQVTDEISSEETCRVLSYVNQIYEKQTKKERDAQSRTEQPLEVYSCRLDANDDQSRKNHRTQ